jgi:hypothetical protein
MSSPLLAEYSGEPAQALLHQHVRAPGTNFIQATTSPGKKEPVERGVFKTENYKLPHHKSRRDNLYTDQFFFL